MQNMIHDMNTAATRKKQTAFRLDADMLDRLKEKARRENRSLNNYVERVLMADAYDEPNETTKAALEEAKSGKNLETFDLKAFKEFVAAL